MKYNSCNLHLCICTFRRQKGLVELIQSLRSVITNDEFNVTLIVIDNDATPSAKEVFEQETDDFPWPCKYVHEVEPGIPIARNRAIDTAGTDGYLVFVDDDETVAKDWLLELWRMSKITGATFVQGPVQMLVENKIDDWWLKTLFFKQSKKYQNGAELKESWSNNVLVDLNFISTHNCQFDEQLRYDGGTDTLFFQDIVRSGGRGVFASNACVYEVQPKNRLTWKWAVNRQFRYGTTRAMTVMLRRSRWAATIYCLYRGGGMAVIGIGWLLSSIINGKLGLANGVALLSRSAGILSGMLGKRKLEYAR